MRSRFQDELDFFVAEGYKVRVFNYYEEGAPQNFPGQIIARDGRSRWLLGFWDEGAEAWEEVFIYDFSHNWGRAARKTKRAQQREMRYWKRVNRNAASKLREPARAWEAEQ